MATRPKIRRPIGNPKAKEIEPQPPHEIEADPNPEAARYSLPPGFNSSLLPKHLKIQEPAEDPSSTEFRVAPFFMELGFRLRKAMAEPAEKSHPRIQRARIAAIFAEQLLILMDLSPESLGALDLETRQRRFSTVMEAFPHNQLGELMIYATEAAKLAGAVGSDPVQEAFDWRVSQLVFPQSGTRADKHTFAAIAKRAYDRENPSPFIARFTPAKFFPRVHLRPQPVTYGQTMVEQDDKLFVKDNIRYRPLPVAAQLAQTPRQTLLNWIKNKTEFAGRPLQSYYLAPVDRYFVSEESIQRIANRFVKWPSQEPAGLVALGETKDQSGFLTMSDAARIIGISPRTMWLWASRGKAPTSKSLDVIKCTTSDHFYIREKNAHDLKKLVPRSGLQRGRRSQVSAQP